MRDGPREFNCAVGARVMRFLGKAVFLPVIWIFNMGHRYLSFVQALGVTNRPLLLKALASVLCWCGLTAAYAAEAEQTTYELPLRVHLVESRIPPLHSNLTDEQVRTLIDRVNEVWRVAGIQWDLRSIERRPLAREERVISGLRGQVRFGRNELLGAIMSAERDPLVFDVYLVSDLTAIAGVPGVYAPELQSLTSSQRDPSGENDPGRILAHELGHALTLPHVRCTRRGNLMSPGCAAQNRVRLKRDQIRAARTQAELGRPHAL